MKIPAYVLSSLANQMSSTDSAQAREELANTLIFQRSGSKSCADLEPKLLATGVMMIAMQSHPK